jgi:hypothetical protein
MIMIIIINTNIVIAIVTGYFIENSNYTHHYQLTN